MGKFSAAAAAAAAASEEGAAGAATEAQGTAGATPDQRPPVHDVSSGCFGGNGEKDQREKHRRSISASAALSDIGRDRKGAETRATHQTSRVDDEDDGDAEDIERNDEDDEISLSDRSTKPPPPLPGHDSVNFSDELSLSTDVSAPSPLRPGVFVDGDQDYAAKNVGGVALEVPSLVETDRGGRPRIGSIAVMRRNGERGTGRGLAPTATPGAFAVPGQREAPTMTADYSAYTNTAEADVVFGAAPALEGSPLPALLVEDQREDVTEVPRRRSLVESMLDASRSEPAYDGVAVLLGRDRSYNAAEAFVDNEGSEEKRPKGMTATGRCRRALLPLLTLCAALAIIISVAVTSKQDASSTNTEGSFSRYDALELALGAALGRGTAEAFKEAGSHQHRALVWLAEDDAGWVDSRDKNSLLQRFVLAVLFFATGGDKWNDQLGFLSDLHVCDWNVKANVEQIPDQTECSLVQCYHRVYEAPGFTYDFLGAKCLRENSTVDTVRIYGNNLRGSLPSEIKALKSLEYISLWGNEISGSITSVVGELSSLRALYLHRNNIGGPIPESLGQLRNLTDLSLYNNAITGHFPSALTKLTKLEWLSLQDNLLNSTLPREIGDMTNLAYLLLFNNSLSGVIPTEIGRLQRLVTLSIALNAISSTIPPEIGSMTNLKYLGCFSNQMGGRIPRELGRTDIQELVLYDNQLTGTIPPELGDIESLETLELFDNRLSGTIPSEIVRLSNLKKVFLNFNRMSGTLPPDMVNMTALEVLVLDGNEFSGSLPSTLSNLESLRWLTLTNTSLIGNLNAFCDMSLSLFMADCYGDNSEVDCECCHICCRDTVQGPINVWQQLVKPMIPFVEPPPEAQHWNCFWNNQ